MAHQYTQGQKKFKITKKSLVCKDILYLVVFLGRIRWAPAEGVEDVAEGDGHVDQDDQREQRIWVGRKIFYQVLEKQNYNIFKDSKLFASKSQ